MRLGHLVGLRVSGLGFRLAASGCFGVQGLGFRVQSSGFKGSILTWWRTGSAFDSRPQGCGFDSLSRQTFCFLYLCAQAFSASLKRSLNMCQCIYMRKHSQPV